MKNVNFLELVKNYEAIFFDSYGVLRNYNGIIIGVKEILTELDRSNISYFILTNDASRSPKKLVKTFNTMGFNGINEGNVISSGMIAKEYLEQKIPSGKVVYLGTEDCAHYIETVNLKPISISQLNIEQCTDVKAMLLMDDEGFDWNKDINKALNLVRRNNIPVVCANSDQVYPKSKKNISMAIGAIADMIEKITHKNVIKFGKPDSNIYNFAFEHINKNYPIKKSKILMVGDTLETDILGGNKFGIDTLLVFTGNTLENNFKTKILSSGIKPDFYCQKLN